MHENALLESETVPLTGQYLTGIDIYEIDLEGLRGKSRGKPKSGFIRAPHDAIRY